MTFYFFDLETSGFRPAQDRIMQFGGQRTDMNLKPIGAPDNILVKLSEDVLPQPEAVLVHNISPLKVNKKGVSEAEFAKYLSSKVFAADTIAVGYNNLRFDNNFIRFLFWRNFTDAYEWTWKNNCSTWDLLDVIRMTRALRPDGVKWPFDSEGRPANKLEMLADINNFKHNAHDALGDVQALIELAKLIKNKQPRLFDYLLNMRSKNKVAAIVTSGKPFIYTSGRYPSDWQKTTVAVMVAQHPDRGAAVVYDLRIDPDEFASLSSEELVRRWQARGEDVPYFPIKSLSFNRCPAVVADLRVLDAASQQRIDINMELIKNHLEKLVRYADFGDKLVHALQMMDKPRQKQILVNDLNVDDSLYDGFVGDADKIKMSAVRAADDENLTDLHIDFADERLNALLPLYKARNSPGSLTVDEQKWWAEFKKRRLNPAVLDDYYKRLSQLSASGGLTTPAKHLLKDLEAYARSVAPVKAG